MIDEMFLPPGVQLQEPSRMSIDNLKVLLDFWYERQEHPSKKVSFAFKAVEGRNEEIIPAGMKPKKKARNVVPVVKKSPPRRRRTNQVNTSRDVGNCSGEEFEEIRSEESDDDDLPATILGNTSISYSTVAATARKPSNVSPQGIRTHRDDSLSLRDANAQSTSSTRFKAEAEAEAELQGGKRGYTKPLPGDTEDTVMVNAMHSASPLPCGTKIGPPARRAKLFSVTPTTTILPKRITRSQVRRDREVTETQQRDRIRKSNRIIAK